MTYMLNGRQYIVVAVGGGGCRASWWRLDCRSADDELKMA
jgi:hypothetical protein